MKLKVGDKVILKQFKDDDCIEFARDMKEFVGTKTTIKVGWSVDSNYHYKVTNNDWTWKNLKKINSIQSKLK